MNTMKRCSVARTGLKSTNSGSTANSAAASRAVRTSTNSRRATAYISPIVAVDSTTELNPSQVADRDTRDHTARWKGCMGR